MSRTRIKICGIRSVDDAMAVVDAGADAIGLVFVPNSPRYITVAQAKQIAAAVPAFVDIVGLFVDQTAQEIQSVADQVGLKSIQLHGNESAETLNALSPYSVIRSIPCHGTANDLIKKIQDAPADASAFLFDAPPVRTDSGLQMGGTGHKVNWAQLAEIKSAGHITHSLVLAGGLTPENVSNAIEIVHPYAVDVSSGVEREKGIKDMELIHAFCRAVINSD